MKDYVDTGYGIEDPDRPGETIPRDVPTNQEWLRLQAETAAGASRIVTQGED